MAKRIDIDYIKEIQLTVDTYKKFKASNQPYKAVAKALGVNESTVSRRLQYADEHKITENSDIEIILENVRLAKQKQLLQDTQRVERKSFRELARVENAVEVFYKEVAENLKTYKPFKPKTPVKSKGNSSYIMVVHWSDHHLNERVELAHNTFDWIIAAKRLKKHVMSAKRIATAYGVKKIHVQFTGDLINSDRRLDEVIANAGNRAKAALLAIDLYRQALEDLGQDFIVTFSGVSGNESRIQKDLSWVAEGATDNYDFVIYESLGMMLKGSHIEFIRPTNHSESVLNINGLNVLFIHGHGAVGTNNIQKAVQEVKGRYIANGVRVDLVFWGHIHEAIVADWYGRSSSLVGSNTYNENALNLAGRASQNVYLLNNGGGFDGVKIDLQNADDFIGYDLNEMMFAYNTKSAAKLHAPQTIVQVVI